MSFLPSNIYANKKKSISLSVIFLAAGTSGSWGGL